MTYKNIKKAIDMLDAEYGENYPLCNKAYAEIKAIEYEVKHSRNKKGVCVWTWWTDANNCSHLETGCEHLMYKYDTIGWAYCPYCGKRIRIDK